MRSRCVGLKVTDIGHKKSSKITLELLCQERRNNTLVTPAGFEPAIAGLRTRSPGPLDEGAKAN